jgi:GGDEF domain-containing protein
VAPGLRGVAEQLQAYHRASDVSGHLGEGVFVIVLAASSEAGAQAILRRVVNGMSGVEFTYGVASHDQNCQSPGELLTAVLARVGVTAGAYGYGPSTLDPPATPSLAH